VLEISDISINEWKDLMRNIPLPIFRGVDMVKLDYVTPGSPDNGVNLLENNSGIVVCYHNAIAQQKRQIRLDISWKLSRDEPFYTIWNTK
jgi:alpha-galactosidase